MTAVVNPVPPVKENQWARKARVLAQGGTHDRILALESKHCPPDVVDTLTEDSSEWVCRQAWAHPNLTLEKMREGVFMLRHAAVMKNGRVIRNPNNYFAPRSTYFLIQNPNLPADLVAQFPEDLAVRNVLCPERVILLAIDLSNINHLQHRTFVARNTGITEKVQLLYVTPQLGTARDRLHLARNTALTTNVITQWIPLEPSPRILRYLIGHKNTTPDLRTRIFARLRHLTDTSGKPMSQSDRAAIVRYSTDVNEILTVLGYNPEHPHANLPATILKEAVYNPLTPAPIIMVACNHSSSLVRKTAARHPNCPEEGRVIVGLRS